MRFLVYCEQSGEGCDYTIGCGRCLAEIEAASMVDARAFVLRTLRGEAGEDECTEIRGSLIGEEQLQRCVIYAIEDEEEIDLAAASSELVLEQDAEERREKERRERVTFERLRRKYGKT